MPVSASWWKRTRPSQLKSNAYDACDSRNLLNLKNAAGNTLLDVFILNGNVKGLRLMHELGADLKHGYAKEPPIRVCMRWHYLELVEYILGLHLYSREEVEAILNGAKNPVLIAVARKAYPGILKPKKKEQKSWFADLSIFH